MLRTISKRLISKLPSSGTEQNIATTNLAKEMVIHVCKRCAADAQQEQALNAGVAAQKHGLAAHQAAHNQTMDLAQQCVGCPHCTKPADTYRTDNAVIMTLKELNGSYSWSSRHVIGEYSTINVPLIGYRRAFMLHSANYRRLLGQPSPGRLTNGCLHRQKSLDEADA